MRRALVALIGLLGLTLLGACASLTQNQCRTGDWYGIGVRDGENGRLPSYFSKNLEACAKFGITPQREPWEKGRQVGLQTYCTPQNAYRIGRRGQTPSPVCTAAQAADMSLPNRVGLKYFHIGQEIERIRSDIQDIDATLAGLSESDAKYAARLLLERSRLRFEQQQLELKQLRYATWP